jgi:hypothetical protein
MEIARPLEALLARIETDAYVPPNAEARGATIYLI